MNATPRLKDHEFTKRLGRGGFGEVWLANYLPLDQRRAVKLLPKDQWSDDAVERMLAEAKVMAALPKHPNRVQVYSILNGITNCFLSMEYLDGGALSDQVSVDHPMPWEKATRYVVDVAKGLKDVHALGILHRDIKPDNILLDTRRDEAALADFGIAVYSTDAAGPAGTPCFCAPEIMKGEFATSKSDVYSLAVTLFFLVVGSPPDRNLSWDNNPELATVPDPVVKIIQAGMQLNPDDRPDLETFEFLLRQVRHAELTDRLLASIDHQSWETQLKTTLAVSDESACDVFEPIEIDNLKHVSFGLDDLVRLESYSSAEGFLHVLILNATGSLDVVVPNASNTNNRVIAGQRHTLVFKLSPPSGTDYVILVWTRKDIRPNADQWRSWLEDRRLRLRDSEVSGPESSVPESTSRTAVLVLHQSETPPRGDWIAKVLPITHTE